MKQIVSISLDMDTIIKLKEHLRNSKYRNRSHFMEELINNVVRNK